MRRQSIRGTSGKMKTFSVFLWVLLLFLMACEKDPLINGDCSQTPPGMLCKTYFFENDLCIGYIEHHYDNAYREESQVYKSPKGQIKMTVTFTYNAVGLKTEERIIKETSDNTESIFYYYNSLSKPTLEEYYTNGSLSGKKAYFYNDTLLTEIQISNTEGLDSVITYEYDTDYFLWRTSFFNRDSTLISREIHSFYENNIERIDLYDAFNVFKGYHLLHSDSNGNMLTDARYNADQILNEKIIYTYIAGKPEKISLTDAMGQVKSYTVFFYN